MITRDRLGGANVIDVGWQRTSADGTKAFVDTVDFEIKYDGIEELEKYIKSYSACIICNVHFNANTDDFNEITMYVWGLGRHSNIYLDTSFLSEDEKNILKAYALDELIAYRNGGFW